MTPENFVYWLNGCLELGNPETLNAQQIQVIKDHIALVLKKETPMRRLPDEPRVLSIFDGYPPVSC